MIVWPCGCRTNGTFHHCPQCEDKEPLPQHKQREPQTPEEWAEHICMGPGGERRCFTLRETAEIVRRIKAQAADEATAETQICVDAVNLIRDRLIAADVPMAAFIDDHVGNAIAQRDEAKADAIARPVPVAPIPFVPMGSTTEMRARIRELAMPPKDDFDRAVLIITADFDRLH